MASEDQPSRRMGSGELHDLVYGTSSHEKPSPRELAGRYLTQLQVAIDRKEPEAIAAVETQLSELFNEYPELRPHEEHE